MTPKEKAEELVDKMYNELPDHYDVLNQAKRCALIAVDEILKDRQYLSDFYWIPPFKYWQQVKNEIELL